jgi:hypothetical protein
MVFFARETIFSYLEKSEKTFGSNKSVFLVLRLVNISLFLWFDPKCYQTVLVMEKEENPKSR